MNEHKLLNLFDQLPTGQISKIDFESSAEVTLYYGDTKDTGFNIVKNNDMLQYHYFSQEYNILKVTSVIAILSMNFNGIKYYIGFINLNYSSLSKIMRHRYFGKNMYLTLKGFTEQEFDDSTHYMTINRTVMMPNFRGLGLSKLFQREAIKQLYEIPRFQNIVAVELYSNLLHSFNFLDPIFNDVFTNSENVLSKKQFAQYYEVEKSEKNRQSQDYKGETKYIANYGFNLNPKNYYRLVKYYQETYGVTLDFDKKRDVPPHIYIEALEGERPLIIWQYTDISEEEYLSIDYTQIQKDIRKKYYPSKIIEQENHFE